MSGIFGFLRRDGVSVSPLTFETLRRHTAEWISDGCGVLLDGPAAMGQMRLFSTPEARYEKMPIVDAAEGFIFTASGRVDNREELIADCGLRVGEYEISGTPDGEVILQAYRKWGDDSPKRIYGDWAFAAYHQKERRLFLARDHYGNTSLYYYADPGVFAFASSRKALLALNLAPIEMDELYLAQVLVTWPAYHGERTIHRPIKRLPPSHCITVTPERMDVRQYWRLEDTPELLLPKREDYVEAFHKVFDAAVLCRLRPEGAIASTLSGGLDSGSVTAIAARFLREKNRQVLAFTSVPLSDTGVYVGNRFGDEFPFAQATARHAGNVDLRPVTAANISPISAIRRMLDIHDEPCHAAGNFFWIQEIVETARANGCYVLLTGQAGNGGVSWEGDFLSQPLFCQLRYMGWRRWVKERTKRAVPAALLNAYRGARRLQDGSWRSSAIHPDFAHRLRLRERWMDAPDWLPPRTPREMRCRIIKPGNHMGGAFWAGMRAAYGLEACDPTADARVLAFTISVPDHIFIDPKTGLDRWLIREAMKGRLPDEVRLNRKRGRQAGDLVPRLRASATEVEDALNELEGGPAAAYVDVPHMREVWRMIQTQDTPEAFRKSVTVLTRGVMAGLFVNGFGKW